MSYIQLLLLFYLLWDNSFGYVWFLLFQFEVLMLRVKFDLRWEMFICNLIIAIIGHQPFSTFFSMVFNEYLKVEHIDDFGWSDHFTYLCAFGF